jgi:CheY-like chemotaxis protein
MAIDPQIRILLVEDFKATRAMQVRILEELGFHHIQEAEDGAAAMETLRKEDVDLIISDWNMPVTDGYELLEWVRSDEKCRDIPFIMATARGEKRQLIKAVMAGVSHFIAKPFTSAELKGVIEETFDKKKITEDILERTASPKTKPSKTKLSVAHIQITDHLVLGALKHLIETGECQPRYFDLETHCMGGWNPVQKAMEKGTVDAALVLAPIAMDLFGYGAAIRMVLFAHQNGSICVRKRTAGDAHDLAAFFQNKTFFIPHILSIHHMLSDLFLTEIGLRPGTVGGEGVNVAFEVVPPVQMPTFLTESHDACGFMVAQPVGKKAIVDGGADLLFLSGEMWEHHPCCVVAMQETFIESHPDAAQEFTEMLVRAGRFIHEKPTEAARMAVDFLDPDGGLKLTPPVLESVLSEPHGIRTDNLFPVLTDLDRIQRYMVDKMGYGSIIDLEKFVDARFAESACGETAQPSSVFHDPSSVVRSVLARLAS